MKTSINLWLSISCMLWIITGFAQTSKEHSLDTIYANDTKNVALFFPSPIRQGIVGNEDFVFTYNREFKQYFGLLQAKPGLESNLLIISEDGSVFSYIVRYKHHLKKLNYFISKSGSIGNEKPLSTDSIERIPEETVDPKKLYYTKFSKHVLNQKRGGSKAKKRKEKMLLSLEEIVFDKDEFYFLIQITNNSSLDYDLNFLNLSVEIRKKVKKKSLQQLYKEPVLKYNLPERIAAKETVKLVYVIPKFSISKKRRAVLELNEKDGERNLKLKIPNRLINHPK